MTGRLRGAALVLVFLAGLAACQQDTSGFVNPSGSYRHDLPVGASARDLLADTFFQSLHIEVQYMPGAGLQPATLTHLETMLAKYLHKPGGFTVTASQILPSDPLFTLEGLKGIEDRNRTAFTQGTSLAVYVLVTNGYYTDDSLIMATALRNTSVVLFGHCISDHASSNGEKMILESTALEHVFGHLMGLVDQGAPMQHNHKDPAFGYHCNNSQCLMYFGATDGNYVGQTWAYDNVVPVLDSNCVADIRAIGGK
ncbi:MAG TPA: hypothetical protein VG870_05225 [Chitinophagaceae bacterium]|nr:hypothetical protein [Chitinophagaceae bacterium]